MRMGVWEILLIVLLVVILFGHAKIPGMMKNLADGLNVFKKEMKSEPKASAEPVEKPVVKKVPAKKKPVKKAVAKKVPAKKTVKK
ncbi:MAG: twin-arginine translocase TatA/TatE family subunit [Alphaproteobacteria bacterium]|nr:twin-arginine translocase TatA/TatE family subunit [Alphaproteobacteria bacterium]